MQSTSNKPFKIHLLDQGFCRIVYITKNPANQTIYYCLQNDAGEEVTLNKCTKEGEPAYAVYLNAPAIDLFEIPTGNSELEKLCAKWIANN